MPAPWGSLAVFANGLVIAIPQDLARVRTMSSLPVPW
jgi:hypothetical protein